LAGFFVGAAAISIDGEVSSKGRKITAIAAAERNGKRLVWKFIWIEDIEEMLLKSAANDKLFKLKRSATEGDAFGVEL
jgi:hypothetical protein